MASHDVVDIHRRALSDYRIALGLELRDRRQRAGYSFDQLASRCRIPAETLRAYEKGSSLPQLVRTDSIGKAYGEGMFGPLVGAARYVYRAAGQQAPTPATTQPITLALYSLLFYGGVTPDQLRELDLSLDFTDD
ncbi:helix-turn-helix domain-containing protein [Prauserella cavernicola]|uniref:Helix-turn-helix domain-containing protein n=1 Tax=Prauserella cavernicola TaxID=2800127 RepID=A0A934V3K4_9PSEU|nr:helix-turn-helix transcriptional regulator [Prauserella cavernicola]MBK1784452.1 helix-turn-helix domain-containing protein [Prauserella cavernicola]